MGMDSREAERLVYDTEKVASFADVHVSRVHYVGAAENGHQYRVLCKACLERKITAPRLSEPQEGPVLMEREVTIELLPRLTQIDNRQLFSYVLLVGQCLDCGEVYFAKFPSPKER